VPDTERSDNVSLFDGVYRCHYRVIYAYLLGRVQEPDTAADLLQDTFVRVWRHMDDMCAIPGERQLYWILGIARNLTHDHFRRRLVRGREESIAEYAAANPQDPYAALEARETLRVLDGAIRSLPPSLRVPFTLSVIAGLNSNEIARIVARPAATVRYQIAEARRRIAREARLDTGSQQESAEE
jgi:RNA polymerase sigma-70 factor (ECF subfamily)